MKRAMAALTALGWLAAALLAGCGGAEKGLPFDPTPPVLGTPTVTREAVTNRVLVQVQAFDVGTGVASVTVLAVGLDPTPTPVAMQQVAGTEQYQATLPASIVRLQVKAVDRGGNETVSAEIRVPPPSPPF
ncbi:MAG: hypothetical protein RMM08_00665 [Armatimonadota bacterium]|nr:hypothetical protein [bacterium]MDW8319847.1 hypothetical protein [Armatimonadota bacterium]